MDCMTAFSGRSTLQRNVEIHHSSIQLNLVSSKFNGPSKIYRGNRSSTNQELIERIYVSDMFMYRHIRQASKAYFTDFTA